VAELVRVVGGTDDQGGQQSTNEQSGHLIDRLLMSAGLRLIDWAKIGKIDRLDWSVVPRRGGSLAGSISAFTSFSVRVRVTKRLRVKMSKKSLPIPLLGNRSNRSINPRLLRSIVRLVIEVID
jgi:hypothetical protein